MNPSTKIRAFNHLLGESGLSFMATPQLAARYRRGFPQTLNDVPILLPAENTVFRRSLEQWFDSLGIRPLIRGEFSDPGLLKVFGQNGTGVFPVRTAVEQETAPQYGAKVIGRVDSIREASTPFPSNASSSILPLSRSRLPLARNCLQPDRVNVAGKLIGAKENAINMLGEPDC